MIKFKDVLQDLNNAKQSNHTLYEYYLINSNTHSEKEWQKYMLTKLNNMSILAYFVF